MARRNEGREVDQGSPTPVLRYAVVSAAFLPLWALVVWGLEDVVSDIRIVTVAAGAAVAVPSFFANRGLVWRVERAGLQRDGLRYALVTVASLALAFGATVVIDGGGIERLGAPWETGGVVALSHLVGFGSVSIVRFVLLDRLVFADRALISERGARHGDVRI